MNLCITLKVPGFTASGCLACPAMRADSRFVGTDWQLEIGLDPEDDLHGLGQWDLPIELVAANCRVELPFPANPHPDLVGLATLLVVRPWAKRRLWLNNPVSSQLAKSVANEFGIELGPVDSGLSARPPGSVAATGLSLGPDCLAGDVLLDLPKKAFYFVRVPHPAIPNRATHIRHDVVIRRLEEASRRGWDIEVARSDLEFMAARPFPTFAHWTTMNIGAVLTADVNDLGYIVSGRHMGGHYIHSGKRFDLEADHDLRLREVFKAVGLELVSAVAGLSEVGTMIIAREHELFDLSSSCLLSAKPLGGCEQCEKCFRKELARAWVENRLPRAKILAWGEGNTAFRRRFENFETTPQPHSYAFLASRMESLAPSFLGEWLRRFPRPHQATAWVDRWYPPAIGDWLPGPWRRGVTANLESRLPVMDSTDREAVEGWPRALLD